MRAVRLDSSLFAFLMNTKGLIALVIANLGLNEGIITERLYAMLIAFIIFSEVTTGPMIGTIYRLAGTRARNTQRVTRCDGVWRAQ